MSGQPKNRESKLASVAFIHLPRLFEQEPAKSFDALQELHLRLKALDFPKGVTVLSAATGAIIVAPDGALREPKPAIHHYFNGLFAACNGLPLRIGVTHGTVEFFSDVQRGTYIGKPINTAARIATAPENHGVLFEKSYHDYRHTSVDRDLRRPGTDDAIKVEGKEHDVGGFKCFEAFERLMAAKDFARLATLGHKSVNEVAAFIVTVDLPRFSSGETELLSKRFRAFVDAAQKVLAENRTYQLHYSPGGDGGVFAFPTLPPGQQARMIVDRFAKELANETLFQIEAASVESRIGTHYGLVQIYRNAQGRDVPTGHDCFVAEQIAKDIAGGSIACSDVLRKDGGSWFAPSPPTPLIGPVSGPRGEPVHRFLLKGQLKSAVAPVPPAAPSQTTIGVPSAKPVDFKADISRILKYAPAELIGRETERQLLHDAWAGNWKSEIANRKSVSRPHVLTFVALGGEGKTSLVAKWAADLAVQDWPGCDAAFAWSFYSQGTREQGEAPSDEFLKKALAFFGDDADKAFAASPAGAFEKGQRLARLVGQRRSLLILDGLEPLQYAPTAPTPGELKDQGLAALLKGLAAASHGLCVVTTRYSLPDLKAFWQTTAPEVNLLRLSRDAGVHLLKTLGVRGTAQEFAALVEDVKGHALTLTLLGGFLKRAFHGDIRQRDRVKFEKADEKIDGGHAFRTMAAYEQWLLRDSGDEGRREVAVLRLMGLFDRPADIGCLHALLQPPAIPGLTEPLVGLAEDDWEFCLTGLESARLLTVNRDASANRQSAIGNWQSLDAHPHLRDYFAKQLREQKPDVWQAGHRRLYEHLCASTHEGNAPTLEALQPLYQAVAHGCQAGLQQEAHDDVLIPRIWRGTASDGFYSTTKLGAFGSDLGAIASFYETPWRKVNPVFADPIQASIMGVTAFRLRALGRLSEALEPMRAGLENRIKRASWKYAAIEASNLSELEVTLGEVAQAERDAAQSVTYADRSGDAFERQTDRVILADALHHAGKRAEAEAHFREAELMQTERQPEYPLLYSGAGFRYCDLLLTEAERAAWETMFRGRVGVPPAAFGVSPKVSLAQSQSAGTPTGSDRDGRTPLIESCRAVSQRAAQALKIAERNNWLLDIALDHLTLGRAALYRAILEGSSIGNSQSEIENAVAGLRRAGQMDELPKALLTRAWLRFLEGKPTGPESAQADLDEAWEIAERGPMKLFMADVHLHRARLFGLPIANRQLPIGNVKYPWESPEADLKAAEELINRCGYHRRDEELADAQRALNLQP
jgi:class 3 adenylate cyclase